MNDRSVAVYRRLTMLYPGAFRDGYRDDLVALFADQLRDESRTRVWCRVVRDLAVTVPARHVEVRMHRPSGNIVTIIAGTIAVSALVLGSSLGGLFYSFLIALGAGAVALWSWNASRPVRPARAALESWWRVLLAGLGVLAITFSAMAFPWPDRVDLGGDVGYLLAFFSIMTGLTTVGVGVLLGVVAFVQRGRPGRTRAPVA